MSDTPVRVTIGMPVFNGERTLASAIEALLSQTYQDFQLIISDNASTDGTAQICAAFAAGDPRIIYIRQSHNIGADTNFEFVLAQASSEYFMWAAADDTRSPEFIASNLLFLEQHADYVGSTCQVRFEGGEYDPVQMGDETRAEPTGGARIGRFFDVWHANGRFYSLFRRSDVADAMCGLRRFHASDWALVVRLLARGKLNRLDSGSVDLGRDGASHKKGFMGSFRTRTLHWMFPFLELAQVTWRALEGQGLVARITVARKLWRLNCKAVRDQLNYATGRTR